MAAARQKEMNDNITVVATTTLLAVFGGWFVLLEIIHRSLGGRLDRVAFVVRARTFYNCSVAADFDHQRSRPLCLLQENGNRRSGHVVLGWHLTGNVLIVRF